MPTLDDIHVTDAVLKDWVTAGVSPDTLDITLSYSLSRLPDHEDLDGERVRIGDGVEFAFRRAVDRDWAYDIVPAKRRTVDDYVNLGEVIDE